MSNESMGAPAGHHKAPVWVAILTSAIGAAGVVLAAIIGVDAKRDRASGEDVLARKNSQIQSLTQQLQEAGVRCGDSGTQKKSGAAPSVATDGTVAAEPVSSNPQSIGLLPMVVRNEGFLIELRSCTLQRDEVECKFLVTAESEDSRFNLNSWSRLVESDGNEMKASRIQVGDDQARGQSHSVSSNLVRGVPVKMSIQFAGLNLEASGRVIRLIELSGAGGGAQFQHVPVQ